MKMKKLMRSGWLASTFYLACLLLSGYGLQAQTAWTSPTYKAEAYQKIAVLAKVNDDMARRFMEDAMVKALQDKGYGAIPSYPNFSSSQLATEDSLVKRAEELGVDALILFSDPKQATEYKQRQSVSANVGVPVRVGFMHVYLGTNVPITGGSSKKQTVTLKCSFYNRSSRDAQWSLTMSEKYKDDPGALAKKLAATAFERLKKDKIIL
jgi:predicted CoA-binding protein